jgi:hypothetical protein
VNLLLLPVLLLIVGGLVGPVIAGIYLAVALNRRR